MYKILINELHWILHNAPTLHFAIFPDCGSCVNYGMIRLPSLEKRHHRTKVCKMAQQKWDKNAKKKEGRILSFLRPKAAIIPLTVNSPPPVHSYKLVPQSVSNASPAAASITYCQAGESHLQLDVQVCWVGTYVCPTASSRCYNIWSKTYQWVSLKCMNLRGWPCGKKSWRNWGWRRGCAHTNDVILLYLDMCLITLVS